VTHPIAERPDRTISDIEVIYLGVRLYAFP
jgi:hypothetical protein